MKWPQSILVSAREDTMGDILLETVSEKYGKAFASRAKSNGAGHYSPVAFIQQGIGDAEFLAELRPAQRRDIEAGWRIRFKSNPWAIAHYWGYDAHTVVEDGAALDIVAIKDLGI
jgi:hypothetical protein